MKAKANWKSFVGPSEPLVSLEKTTANASLPKNLEQVQVKQESIKAFSDPTWTAMNEASVNLLKGQKKNDTPLEKLHKKEVQVRRRRKKRQLADKEEEEEKVVDDDDDDEA